MTTNASKWALVTGGSDGIGKELAKLLAADGYNLILVARTQSDLDQAAAELKSQSGIQVEVIAKDLFQVSSGREIYDEVKRKGIQVSVLVNDAGQGEYGFFHEYPAERDIDIINLNITSLVSLTKYFLKDMLEMKQGRILNLASMVSKNPSPLLAIYSASKAFVYSFSMALRNELKDTGVSVTALLPGATDTDFFNKAGMLNTKEYNENYVGDPADVAKEGYEALMNNEEKVVASNLKNRVMTHMANVMPDSMIAENMRENHMKNMDGTEGKEGASRSEGSEWKKAASLPSEKSHSRDDSGPREGAE
jgi:short-subunit dehydrogenase